MQIYGAPEGTRGCNRLFIFIFFYLFFFYYYYYYFFFMSLPGRQIYIFLTLIFLFFSPFPGHEMFIFWPVENCTTWNLRYLMLRDAGWALRHWRSCWTLHCLTKCALEIKLLNQNCWSWYHFSQKKLPRTLILVIASTYCGKYAVPFFMGHPVYCISK